MSDPRRRVTIALEGLDIPCRIGVTDDERRELRLLRVDARLTPLDPSAYADDAIEGTIDYAIVAALVAEIAVEREYKLIERLATVVADRLWALAPLAELTVVVSKPAPPMPVSAAAASAEVTYRA
jgi:dihydroneopterin aldolase